MSGGYFDYNQYRIRDIVGELNTLIEQDVWDDVIDKDSLIDIINITIAKGMVFEVLVNRIDWLLSGDDGEESFYNRLSDELAELGEYDASS